MSIVASNPIEALISFKAASEGWLCVSLLEEFVAVMDFLRQFEDIFRALVSKDLVLFTSLTFRFDEGLSKLEVK